MGLESMMVNPNVENKDAAARVSIRVAASQYPRRRIPREDEEEARLDAARRVDSKRAAKSGGTLPAEGSEEKSVEKVILLERLDRLLGKREKFLKQALGTAASFGLSITEDGTGCVLTATTPDRTKREALTQDLGALLQYCEISDVKKVDKGFEMPVESFELFMEQAPEEIDSFDPQKHSELSAELTAERIRRRRAQP